MKILECEKQLNSLLDTYNSVMNFSTKFSDVMIYNNISEKLKPGIEHHTLLYADAYRLFELIYNIYENVNIKEEIIKCFNRVSLDFIELYKIAQIVRKNDFKIDYMFSSGLIERIDRTKVNYRSINKINEAFNSLNCIIYTPEKGDHDNILSTFIFQVCTESIYAKNILVNYVNDLEVPTKHDWEMGL